MVGDNELSDLLVKTVAHAKRVVDYCDYYDKKENVKKLSKHGIAFKSIECILDPRVKFLINPKVDCSESRSYLGLVNNYLGARDGTSKHHKADDLAAIVRRDTFQQLNEIYDVYKKECEHEVTSFPLKRWRLVSWLGIATVFFLPAPISLPLAIGGIALSFSKEMEHKGKERHINREIAFKEMKVHAFYEISKEKFSRILDASAERVREAKDKDYTGELFL